MTLAKSPANHFMLEASSRELRCPVLQARFEVSDLRALQTLLGARADDDPELRGVYSLDEAELAGLAVTFDVGLNLPSGNEKLDVSLYRLTRRWAAMPYLGHSGYEIPLLLDGRKKLAKMYGPYPPMTFDGEDRFDHWVAQGLLHRVEVLEPHDPPTPQYEGHRTVYYALKGEEWRIPAMQLIWRAAGKAGGWNESFERLEGMLFGYEDWQNDWWIETFRRRGGVGGASLCCAVSAAGLAWLEIAGFRALPPCDKPNLVITNYYDGNPEKMRDFLLEEADNVALVCFAVPLWPARDLLPVSPDFGGRWLVPSHRVSELNQHLRNAVVVVARRDDPKNS